MPGQRAAQSDPGSEPRTEDVAHEDGQNRSDDDGHDVPETQLLPTVVDDQHGHQRDRCVYHSVHSDVQPTDPRLLRNRHDSTLRSGLRVGRLPRHLTPSRRGMDHLGPGCRLSSGPAANAHRGRGEPPRIKAVGDLESGLVHALVGSNPASSAAVTAVGRPHQGVRRRAHDIRAFAPPGY
jgi:hypothetical protein